MSAGRNIICERTLTGLLVIYVTKTNFPGNRCIFGHLGSLRLSDQLHNTKTALPDVELFNDCARHGFNSGAATWAVVMDNPYTSAGSTFSCYKIDLAVDHSQIELIQDSSYMFGFLKGDLTYKFPTPGLHIIRNS